MDVILGTTEKRKAPKVDSGAGEPHMKLGHQKATEKSVHHAERGPQGDLVLGIEEEGPSPEDLNHRQAL